MTGDTEPGKVLKVTEIGERIFCVEYYSGSRQIFRTLGTRNLTPKREAKTWTNAWIDQGTGPKISNVASVCGINDRIDTVDCLGFSVSAKVLAGQAKSLQDNNEPLCMGLLALWGSGMSFFWKLVNEDLKKRRN